MKYHFKKGAAKMKDLLVIFGVVMLLASAMPAQALRFDDELWEAESQFPDNRNQMAPGSWGNPYEIRRTFDGRYEMESQFPDNNHPMSPGNWGNPIEIRRLR
jgi:hypothetical protein